MAQSHTLSNGDELEIIPCIDPANLTVYLRRISKGHYNGIPIGTVHSDADGATTTRNGEVWNGYRLDELIHIVCGPAVAII